MFCESFFFFYLFFCLVTQSFNLPCFVCSFVKTTLMTLFSLSFALVPNLWLSCPFWYLGLIRRTNRPSKNKTLLFRLKNHHEQDQNCVPQSTPSRQWKRLHQSAAIWAMRLHLKRDHFWFQLHFEGAVLVWLFLQKMRVILAPFLVHLERFWRKCKSGAFPSSAEKK